MTKRLCLDTSILCAHVPCSWSFCPAGERGRLSTNLVREWAGTHSNLTGLGAVNDCGVCRLFPSSLYSWVARSQSILPWIKASLLKTCMYPYSWGRKMKSHQGFFVVSCGPRANIVARPWSVRARFHGKRCFIGDT